MATGTVALEPPKGKLQRPHRSRSRMDRVFGNHRPQSTFESFRTLWVFRAPPQASLA